MKAMSWQLEAVRDLELVPIFFAGCRLAKDGELLGPCSDSSAKFDALLYDMRL